MRGALFYYDCYAFVLLPSMSIAAGSGQYNVQNGWNIMHITIEAF